MTRTSSNRSLGFWLIFSISTDDWKIIQQYKQLCVCLKFSVNYSIGPDFFLLDLLDLFILNVLTVKFTKWKKDEKAEKHYLLEIFQQLQHVM